MNICFISFRYPGKHNTSDFAFVKQLVDAIAKLGHYCQVIAPFNITHYHTFSKEKETYTYGNGRVTVYRPGYLSFSNFHIGNFSPSKMAHNKALQKAFKMLEVKPDVIYGHFWSSAYEGFNYSFKNKIPLFVATGESEINKMFSIPKDLVTFSNHVSGVICVSSKNRDESIALGLTTSDKCVVLPNAVNAELFKKLDKEQCREQLGLPKDVFIVIFVGWFTERKGPQRVVEAIKQIKDENIFSIFIGKGEQNPECDNILFKGAVPHDKVPFYLNAADIFVLPTLHEGCCNAVVEAMACGLPVVSSDLPFNWDVLDETNSIMIKPDTIDGISGAIKILYKNVELREKLAEGALRKAGSLTIETRAKKIINFINSKIS